VTVASSRRRAHRYENGLGIAYGPREFGRENESASLRVGLHNTLQIRFEDRNFPARQRSDLGFILVDASDVMSEISETSAWNQSHISCSNDNDPHELNTFLFGQLPTENVLDEWSMRVKRRNACILQIARRHKYEMWRFTISPEIDRWRNQRQLDQHHVEIFIALSCRECPAAQSLGDLDPARARLAVIAVTVSPNSISFEPQILNSF
jgi:hypothetical protein